MVLFCRSGRRTSRSMLFVLNSFVRRICCGPRGPDPHALLPPVDCDGKFCSSCMYCDCRASAYSPSLFWMTSTSTRLCRERQSMTATRERRGWTYCLGDIFFQNLAVDVGMVASNESVVNSFTRTVAWILRRECHDELGDSMRPIEREPNTEIYFCRCLQSIPRILCLNVHTAGYAISLRLRSAVKRFAYSLEL